MDDGTCGSRGALISHPKRVTFLLCKLYFVFMLGRLLPQYAGGFLQLLQRMTCPNTGRTNKNIHCMLPMLTIGVFLWRGKHSLSLMIRIGVESAHATEIHGAAFMTAKSHLVDYNDYIDVSSWQW